jgi:predicted amidohydrolase YtcJ
MDDVEDPIGGRWGRTPTGRLNGQVYESAAIWVSRRMAAMDPTARILATSIRHVADLYAHWGVTSVNQMAHEASLPTIRAALGRAGVPIRWTVYAWGVPEFSIADAWREVDTDGGVWPSLTRLGGPNGCWMGALLEARRTPIDDYADRSGWRGRSNYTRAAEGDPGWALASPHQVALHVVGDGEVRHGTRQMAELAPAERWKRFASESNMAMVYSGERLARAAAFGVVIVKTRCISMACLLRVGRLCRRRVDCEIPEVSTAEEHPLGWRTPAFASDSVNAKIAANPYQTS